MAFEYEEIPGKWYTIDFHVHSPASHDFKGPNLGTGEKQEDKKYLWLIEQAKKANPPLDVIVITDHNEYRGYERLLELQKEAQQVRNFFETRNLPISEEIQAQVELFRSLVILPGIELDVYPGLHILTIFDPQTDIDEIDRFLERAGYSKDMRNQSITSQYAKWTVTEVCQEVKSLGGITIAAHVDSDKGIYNVLKGQARVAAFNSEALCGMEFNSPISRDQIENLLKNKQYHRDAPLAFIRSSDFHGRSEQQIGEPRTWVRLDNVQMSPQEVFSALKGALRNPLERVADGPPEVVEIRRQLSGEPCVANIEDDADIIKFSEYICTFANSEDGTIVIGRTSKGNWKGVSYENPEKFKGRIDAVIRANIKPFPKIETAIYPCYNHTWFATIRVFKQAKMFSVTHSDRVYMLDRGKPCQASIEAIVRVAEDNLLQRYQKLSITSRIKETSQRLSGTTDTVDILPIVRKLEKKSVSLGSLFPSIQVGQLSSKELQDAVDFNYPSNGYVDGNILMLAPAKPRLKDSYLRITAPKGKCDLSNPIFKDVSRFTGEKLVVVSGGAVYFDDGDDMSVVCISYSPLICQPTQDYSGPSLKFIIAYLKSAVAIWYADRCLKSLDIRNKRILPNILIPNEIPEETEKSITELVEKIIKLERQFLKEEEERTQKRPAQNDDEEWKNWLDDMMAAIRCHNKASTQLIDVLNQLYQL